MENNIVFYTYDMDKTVFNLEVTSKEVLLNRQKSFYKC